MCNVLFVVAVLLFIAIDSLPQPFETAVHLMLERGGGAKRMQGFIHRGRTSDGFSFHSS